MFVVMKVWGNGLAGSLKKCDCIPARIRRNLNAVGRLSLKYFSSNHAIL